MATKKDLVEAYAFSRRRLVTAFVSGAPGGREVEPTRPGRMIVGGIALAVLLLAGAAVAGALTKRTPVDWDQAGLVTDEHGALYIILDEDRVPGEPRLRPIINVTSAQLILGPDVETQGVPDDTLAGRRKGPPIGILDAPSTVPPPDDLVNTGWTSCTGTGFGQMTEVGSESRFEPRSGQAFHVQARESGKRFLIAEGTLGDRPVSAYKYELPAKNVDLDVAVGTSQTAVTVPDSWLALFPTGGSLDARGLGFEGWGKPANLSAFPGARVGDYYVTPQGQTFGITRGGPTLLTQFAAVVLRATAFPGGKGFPDAVDAPPPGQAILERDSPFAAAAWPSGLLVDQTVPGDARICGVLRTAEGEEPSVALATIEDGPGMLEGVDPGEREVNVLSGTGALIRSAGWASDTTGTPHLIDDRGRSYSIAGLTEIAQLGYADVPVLVVPHVWNKLFRAGPDLSVAAALCPPRPDIDPDIDTDTGAEVRC